MPGARFGAKFDVQGVLANSRAEEFDRARRVPVRAVAEHKPGQDVVEDRARLAPAGCLDGELHEQIPRRADLPENPAYALRARAPEMPPNSHQ